jgi:hypothetical protein
MAPAEVLPFQVELSEAHYFELLKQAPRRLRVATRLIAAVEHERKASRAWSATTSSPTS